MSHKAAESLPYLAHPVLMSLGTVNGQQQRFPPFPEIDLNWDGFQLSHLHWSGVKIPNLEGRKQTDRDWGILEWHLDLSMNHEHSHLYLSITPFAMLIKNAQFWLDSHIRETFEEGQERIEIPLQPKKSGNKLEKQWALVCGLHEASQLVQEVFAVHSSLLNTPGTGIVSHGYRERLLAAYKEGYDKFIPGFSIVYNLFDLVAKRIGETAATAMVHNALGTSVPGAAFTSVLLDLVERSGAEIDSLAHFNFKEADHFFSLITQKLDPDDSYYKRTLIAEIADGVKGQFSEQPQVIKEGHFRYLLGSTRALLFSKYSDFIPLPEISLVCDDGIHEVTPEQPYQSFGMLIEAIRQQLTTSIGLLCPFWEYLPRNSCCGGRNRALLEQVWKCTSPNRSKCTLWKRLGCLKQ